MINGSNEKIKYNGFIESSDMLLVELDYFKVFKNSDKVDTVYDKTTQIEFDEYAFSNAYGKVSALVILGSLFITFGVIITLVSLWRGI